MQTVSQNYKELMKQPYIPAPYEISCMLEVIHQEAQEQAVLKEEQLEYYAARHKAIFTQEEIQKPYASGELNYTRVDGTSYVLPKEAPFYYQGAVGTQLSDAAAKIDQIFQITFENGLSYEVKGLTLQFFHTSPVLFSIEDADGTLLQTYTNTEKIFKTNDVFTFHGGMRIHILQMEYAYCRCHLSYLAFGMYVELSNDNVTSMEYRQQIHPLNNTCYTADMKISCLHVNGEYDTENPSSVINFLEKLQDIHVDLSILYHNTKETLRLANMYLYEWSSTGNEVTFHAADLFTFMNSQYYQKNYCTNTSAFALCEQILLDAGIENYEIDEQLYDINIENPLPKGTHKECLQILCNAVHCVCFQDRFGNIIIHPSVWNHVEAANIKKDEMLDVASGTKLEQVKQLEIVYTKYSQSGADEEVCKGVYEPGDVRVEFSAPVVELQVQTGTAEILEQGPYFVRLHITKTEELILTGKKLQEVQQRCLYDINERGAIKTVENPLLSSAVQADAYYAWLLPYIRSDRSYDVTMRGHMEYDPLDIMGLENKFNDQLLIQIEDHTLSFHGALESRIRGRKVIG